MKKISYLILSILFFILLYKQLINYQTQLEQLTKENIKQNDTISKLKETKQNLQNKIKSLKKELQNTKTIKSQTKLKQKTKKESITIEPIIISKPKIELNMDILKENYTISKENKNTLITKEIKSIADNTETIDIPIKPKIKLDDEYKVDSLGIEYKLTF